MFGSCAKIILGTLSTYNHELTIHTEHTHTHTQIIYLKFLRGPMELHTFP